MVEFKDPALKTTESDEEKAAPKRLKKRTKKKRKKSGGRTKSVSTERKESGHPVRHIEALELVEKRETEIKEEKKALRKKHKTDARGRPTEKTIEAKDISKIATMAGLGLKVPDIAAVFNMSKATFERKCRENPSIYEALLKGRAEAKLGLTKKAYKEALSGNTPVLIFLLKTQCGFSENELSTQININMNSDEKTELTKDAKVKMLQEKLSYDDILLLIEKERKQQADPNVIDVTPESHAR